MFCSDVLNSNSASNYHCNGRVDVLKYLLQFVHYEARNAINRMVPCVKRSFVFPGNKFIIFRGVSGGGGCTQDSIIALILKAGRLIGLSLFI